MRKPTKDEAMPIVQRLDAQQATLFAFGREGAFGRRIVSGREITFLAKAPLDARASSCAGLLLGARSSSGAGSLLVARAPLDAESPLGARLPLDAGAAFRCEAILGTNPFPLPEAPPFC